jgi:probable selenium-dependent hydroxylase accessory protein YqeC
VDLADALGLGDRELVSLVGAGGKKTAMARLVEEGADGGLDVAYTTTAHVPPPGYPLVLAAPGSLRDTLRHGGDVADGTARADESVVAFARERVPEPERVDEKLRGFAPGVVDDVFGWDRFDWVLVKADGARMRDFKAPAANEPQIPDTADTVVPVASPSCWRTSTSTPTRTTPTGTTGSRSPGARRR